MKSNETLVREAIRHTGYNPYNTFRQWRVLLPYRWEGNIRRQAG